MQTMKNRHTKHVTEETPPGGDNQKWQVWSTSTSGDEEHNIGAYQLQEHQKNRIRELRERVKACVAATHAAAAAIGVPT